jgi:hypothetical protein
VAKRNIDPSRLKCIRAEYLPLHDAHRLHIEFHDGFNATVQWDYMAADKASVAYQLRCMAAMILKEGKPVKAEPPDYGYPKLYMDSVYEDYKRLWGKKGTRIKITPPVRRDWDTPTPSDFPDLINADEGDDTPW